MASKNPVRSLVALVCACLTLVGLCGCFRKAAPATTEELLVRYAASEVKENCSGTVQADLSLQVMGYHGKVPITVKFDTADRLAHATAVADLSTFESDDYELELYTELLDDAMVCYVGTREGDSTTWKCWTVDTTSKVDILTVVDLLSASELTPVAKDSDPDVAYELAVPSTKVVQTADNLTREPLAVGELDAAALKEAVASDRVVVDFTEDCLVRSISTDVMLTYKGEETKGHSVPVELDIRAVFDGYGTVKAESLAVPDEVRAAAVPTDTPIDIGTVLSS